MTTSFKKRRNKQILALGLSSLMFFAAATSLAACGNDSDSSTDNSEVTETDTDTARIKNGSFEFYDDNGGKNLIITSPTGWSKTTNSSAQGSASSSKTASGIVDTGADAWKNLTEYEKLAEDSAYSQAEALAKTSWADFSAKDKLKFYELWEDEYDDDDDAALTDLSFYDANKDKFNISFDDLPGCENPGTHYTENDEKEENSRVLMLHNSYTDGRGTAQKYTSSTSITLEAGTSARFSVWVKTEDMTFNGTSDEKGSAVNGNRGAYIGITHTVGGTTLDQVQVKNIDTEAFEAEDGVNGWYQYTFYLKGCSYASSSFTVVLGLGQGGSTDKFEYVDGYAFFDDAECEIIRNSAYEEYVKSAGISEEDVVTIDTDADDRLFKADKEYKNVFDYAIDLHADFDAYEWNAAGDDFKIGPTEQKVNNKTYVSGAKGGTTPEGTELYGQLSLKYDDDVTGLFTYSELTAAGAGNAYLKNVVNKAFDAESYPFGTDSADNKILMLLSTDGVAHTAELKNVFSVAPGEYLMISFWVKTSDISGFTGASVALRETVGTNETSISSIDTTSVTTVDIDGEDGELIEDIYDGWQQCFFFVENPSETETRSFTLSFSYGPTTIYGTNNSSYYAGYAAFTGFETCGLNEKLSKKQFSYAATGTYAKSVSLTGNELAADASFDSAASIPEKLIEEDLADLKNYNGVYGGSGYVIKGGEDKSINDYAYAGLINQKYEANYFEHLDDPDYWLSKLTAGSSHVITEPTGWWKDIFGIATQPLLIYNDQSLTNSYGFIGTTQTISSGSYSTVSVRVKVSRGALAYVYLIDTADKSGTLSITTPKYTYWYNDDGDVCDMDPSDSKFDKKKNVAFYLNETNGLYEVNKNWQYYDSSLDGKYYANLSNYEKDEATGNLLVADGGVSYNYDASVWKHDGNDGIAYYCKDGKYYAYSNHTTEVTDFSAVEKLPARTTNLNERSESLYMELDNRDGNLGEDWITCTFYIHTGNTDKNYRLEVWNGSRDNDKNYRSNANSYVAFDSNSLDSVSSFDNLFYGKDKTEYDGSDGAIKSIIDKHNEAFPDDLWKDEEDVKANYGKIIYHAYSFYDSPEFLRYDSTLDEDEVGNKYTSYLSSAYSEGIAFLYYEDTEQVPNNPLYTMFVDYGYTEVSVTADVTDDTTDDVTDEDDSSDANMWLFVSSLVIAVVLLLAVISLFVQKLVKKAHLKKARAAASNATSLNTAKRRYAKNVKSAAKEEKKAPAAKEEAKDDNDPYND